MSEKPKMADVFELPLVSTYDSQLGHCVLDNQGNVIIEQTVGAGEEWISLCRAVNEYDEMREHLELCVLMLTIDEIFKTLPREYIEKLKRIRKLLGDA